MQSELIESVRALAECVNFDSLGRAYDKQGRQITRPTWPALLAALERAERIEKAARELWCILKMNDGPDKGEYMDALLKAIQ